MLGHTIVGYIDDTFLISQSQSECDKSIVDTKHLFEELSVIVHPTQQQLFTYITWEEQTQRIVMNLQKRCGNALLRGTFWNIECSSRPKLKVKRMPGSNGLAP